MSLSSNQKLVYRDTFRSLHYEAFQAWFEKLARAMHSPGSFQAIRQARGDGGLDGFVIDSQIVYQVYAPARMNELRDSLVATKISSDFRTAFSTLSGQIREWWFVHNHPEGKIGKLSTAAISTLQKEHPKIRFGILDINSLWDRLSDFSEARASDLFGPAGAASVREDPEKDIPAELADLLRQGRDLRDQGRYDEARVQFESVVEAALRASDNTLLLTARIDICEVQLFEEERVAEARDFLLQCLRGFDSSDSRRREVLGLLGQAELLLGNISEARSCFGQALSLAREHQDRFGQGHALLGLSEAESLLGNPERAHGCLDDALDLYRVEYREAATPNDKQRAGINLGGGLSNKARYLRREGKSEQSILLLEQAARLFTESNSNDNLGRSVLLQAEVLRTEGKFEDAWALTQQALKKFEDLGNRRWQGRCLSLMARLLIQAKRDEHAMVCLEQAVDRLDGEHADRQSVPFLLETASISRALGKSDRATECVRTARMVAQKYNDANLLAECSVAEACSAGDDSTRADLLRDAVSHLEEALRSCEVRGRRAVYARRLGMLHGQLENYGEACDHVERALREFEAVRDYEGVGECLAFLAAAARERGFEEEAIAVLERLLTLSRQRNLLHLQAGALHDLAHLLTSRGDLALAERLMADARGLAEKHQFRDVLEAGNVTSQHLEHADMFRQPPRHTLGELLNLLHVWCREHPSHREAILPLWYYAHGTELWSVCRSMVGAKFLIPGSDVHLFEKVVKQLRAHAHLCVFGVTGEITQKAETELIPWCKEGWFPQHLRHVVFDGGPPEAAKAAEALVRTLRDRPYVVVPFDIGGDVSLYAFGRHMRLPATICHLMLDATPEELVLSRIVCMPLGEKSKDADFLHVMRVASENGMVPVFVNSLPHHSKVTAVCDAQITVPTFRQPAGAQDVCDVATALWLSLVDKCSASARESLLTYNRGMADLFEKHRDACGRQEARVYVVSFPAGGDDVHHPALVLHFGE